MTTLSKEILGVVDTFELDFIKGWACYKNDDTPVTLELLINGRIMGSFHANRFRQDLVKVRADGRMGFHCPLDIEKKGLKKYLPLSSKMIIRDTITGQILKNGEKEFFGNREDGSNDFVNDQREKFNLNKGSVIIPLSEYSAESKANLLSFLKHIIEVTQSFGNDLIICYGTLLGAARQKNFLPHDDDIDCAYIAKSTDMVSASKELVRYSEYLKSKGFFVRIDTNGQFHIDNKQLHCGLDIFLSWFSNDKLNLTFTVKEGISRNDVYPLTMIELSGMSFPTISRYDLLLEAIYGPLWVTPDPAFSWNIPKDISNYFLPLHNYNLHANLDYWANYYKDRQSLTSPPPFPSQFAIFVLSQNEEINCIIDIGCGNGRDSFFMGKLGIKVIAADYENGIIENNNLLALKEGLSSNLSFHLIDFSDLSNVSEFIDIVSKNSGEMECRCFYSRFFFHAVDINTQASVFEFLKRAIKPGDIFACEFRVESDIKGKKITGNHYRRYIRQQDFIRHALSFGLDCYYSVEGAGYANYKIDDAIVTRLLFRKMT